MSVGVCVGVNEGYDVGAGDGGCVGELPVVVVLCNVC